MDALNFLQDRKASEPEPIYVLAGGERFLKRLALDKIELLTFKDAANDWGRSVYEGDSATLAAVRDDLEMAPFIALRRLVVVQEADAFITRYREQLEKYVEHPSRTGVLVLDVKGWKSNTRLAKAISDRVTIKCEPPTVYRLAPWCSEWSSSRHGKQLSPPAANLLVELVGAEMGVLDQELAKLATYIGGRSTIEPQDVDTLVGHSRVETAWQVLDAIAEGNSAQALSTLHYLFDQGEEPIAIFGAMSWQLRRLAQVA